MLILAKWSPGVKPWGPRAPIFLCWSPKFFSPEPWIPETLVFAAKLFVTSPIDIRVPTRGQFAAKTNLTSFFNG